MRSQLIQLDNAIENNAMSGDFPLSQINSNGGPFRVGIVGAGGVGGLGKRYNSHAGGYTRIPECDLVAIADINEERLHQFGDEWDIAPEHRYNTAVEMYEKANLDVVSVTTHNLYHHGPVIEAAEAGIKVIHKCTSVRHSLKAERIGCDAVSVDGFECGGHPGEDDIPNMILLPRAAEELTIPFVSSGGMADARSLVASLAMGADGMNMGTRFIATQEAPVHENVKQALVDADELQTQLIMRPLRNTERVLRNSATEKVLEIEREKGSDLDIEHIRHLVSGAGGRTVLHEGKMDAGVFSCGMVTGLIHDIPTCKELIDRIMAEANEIIRGRLEGLLSS